MPLIYHPTGNYQFLPIATAPRIVGAAPFSSGVRALPGFEIVHATFQIPLPYRAGFAAAAQHLAAVGRPRTALCAVEVRVPRPLTMDEFTAFNPDYRALLGEWGVLVDGQVPIARSNVAPLGNPPTASQILGSFALDYTEAGKHGDMSRKKWWARGEHCPMVVSVGQAPALGAAGTRPFRPTARRHPAAISSSGPRDPGRTGLPAP